MEIFSFGLLKNVFPERLSVCVCASVPFGSEDGMWDLIVLVRDHCLPFFTLKHFKHTQ